ncbi:hypothetical protein [Caballeronia sp. SBC2]|uniref:hypothetical protein n=1 Tax=Caballeronia sp. SBC2 TaxID=2705547 RepID=UPI0013E20490|nr:hypothetical protein [Caballeronia sp. SBC2]QIE29648.1 hypothetical protein SBC2_77240 [Caballeronia sp. SBC2]
MRTEDAQALTDNDFFEPLGVHEGAQFVRNKRFNSVLKLSGKINRFMLNQIAPLSFWQNNFEGTSKDTGLSEARAFLQRACEERGFYDEQGIAERKLWNAKRAEQPAPVIAASGASFGIHRQAEGRVRVRQMPVLRRAAHARWRRAGCAFATLLDALLRYRRLRACAAGLAEKESGLTIIRRDSNRR